MDPHEHHCDPMHKIGPEKHPWGIWQDSGSAPNQSPRVAPPDRGKPHGHGPSPTLHLTCQVTSVTALTMGLPPVGTGRQWVGWGGRGMPQRVRLNLLLVLWRFSHSFLTVKDTWLYCTPILWRPWCISLYSFCLFMNTFVFHFPHGLFLLLLFHFRIYLWKRILSLLQGQLILTMQLGRAVCPVLPDPSEPPYSSNMPICSVLPFLGIPQLPLFFFFLILWAVCLES